jgi:uncharacterized protein
MDMSKITEVLSGIESAALAFSGGVDSCYLLYAAVNCGMKLSVYYVNSQFQPQFELDDAKKLADSLGVNLSVIELDVLQDEKVILNPHDRCYHCKRVIFGNISERAKADGFNVIMGGSNASDSADDRHGMKDLAEMSVRSPLREAGLSKDEIRSLSREAGLFTWDKPAYACLATRIPTGRKIDAESLTKVENAENIFMKMGFSDLRCRLLCDGVKIQLPKTQLEKAAAHHVEITNLLSPFFNDILLDLKQR